MAQTNTRLSPIKEIYCINCHEELILDLAERRGEKQIICPKCKISFSIKEAEEFMKNISPITEGKCPNCMRELTFDIEDRISKDKIKCPACKDLFYIDEVETYNDTPKIEQEENRKEEDIDTYSILKYYLPDVEKDEDIYGVDYYIKKDGLNKNLFLTWFAILDLSLALIISLVNKPNDWRYTFGDWLLDFLGLALGFLIPSILVAWIIAVNVKGSRKLSEDEIEKYKNKYNSKK